jgi:hypothetical protein
MMTTSLASLSEPLPAYRRVFSTVFFTQFQMTNYAQFNTLTVTGRIADAKIATGANGDFLACTVLSTATNDGMTIAYNFTNSAGLLALFQGGHFCKGREVTITGHIASIESVYKAKDGSWRVLQQPRVKLNDVALMTGGLGRKPAAEAKPADNFAGQVVTMVEPAIDKAPVAA